MAKNKVTSRGFISENLSASYTLEVHGDINVISGAVYVNGVTSSAATGSSGVTGGGERNQIQIFGSSTTLSASSDFWYDGPNKRLYNSGSSLTAGRIYINEDLSGYITSSFGAMFFRDANVTGGTTLESLVNGAALYSSTFSADGNLLTNIKVYLVNPGAAGVTLTVPSGQRTYAWTIIKSGSLLGTISIAPTGGALINGQAGTVVLSSSLSASAGRTWVLHQVESEFFVNNGS